MEEDGIPEFSFLGGPLHRLGCRLGLVRGKTNTIRLGIALGLSAWGVLMLLALLQGVVDRIFSLALIGVHARFLVAVPLFFMCETLIAPRMAEFSRYIVRSGLVPESGLPALASDMRRIGRMKDSWPAEALFLLVAYSLDLIELVADMPGQTGGWGPFLAGVGGKIGPSLGWYLGFCLPLFRFLMLRLFWWLGLWWYFLWRVEKLELHLVPTHPDRAAGLGYLEVVHEFFSPLVVAVSAVLSAQFAEEISAGTMEFKALYHSVPMALLLVAALFIGPLFIFFRKLRSCRVTGWNEYMIMASRYMSAFEQRWIRDKTASGESQLGTPDLQSGADLANLVNIVSEMRFIPAGMRLVVVLAAAVLLPMLPLALLKYPVEQLAARLFQALTGL